MIKKILASIFGAVGVGMLGIFTGFGNKLVDLVFGENAGAIAAEYVYNLWQLSLDHPWISWPIPFLFGIVFCYTSIFVFDYFSSFNKATWQQHLASESAEIALEIRLKSTGMTARPPTPTVMARYERLRGKLLEKAKFIIPEIHELPPVEIASILEVTAVYLEDNDLAGLKAMALKNMPKEGSALK